MCVCDKSYSDHDITPYCTLAPHAPDCILRAKLESDKDGRIVRPICV
jgi:hypothetical protein